MRMNGLWMNGLSGLNLLSVYNIYATGIVAMFVPCRIHIVGPNELFRQSSPTVLVIHS